MWMLGIAALSPTYAGFNADGKSLTSLVRQERTMGIAALNPSYLAT